MCPEKYSGGDGGSTACGSGAGEPSRAQDCTETGTLSLERRGGEGRIE